MEHIIIVDDTGTAGATSNSKHISPDTKTWVGVLLESNVAGALEQNINEALQLLREKLDITEFHFTEIYSGKKQFRNISSEDRLEIFEFFSQLYNLYTPMVFVSSTNNKTIVNSNLPSVIRKLKLSGFDPNKNDDFSLLLLVLKCTEFMDREDMKHLRPVTLYIDEGKQKKDTVQIVSDSVAANTISKIHYKSSNDFILLQFADFIAFSLNRIQTNLTKEKMSHFDLEFMKIIGLLEWRGDFEKIKATEIDNFKSTYYDEHLDEIYLKRSSDKESEEYKGIVTRIEEYTNGIISLKKFIEDRKNSKNFLDNTVFQNHNGK